MNASTSGSQNTENSFVVCPNCGSTIPASAIVCPNCNFNLKASQETHLLDQKVQPEIKRAPVGSIPLYFQRIRFMIDGKYLELPSADKLTVGRVDVGSTDQRPDVDLTPFDALEKGVSRNHISLAWKNDLIYVADLGSRNGTHLNGQRLMPTIPRLLRDGDELLIGQLAVRVFFADNQRS